MKTPAIFLPASLSERARIVDLGDVSSLRPLAIIIGCTLVERVGVTDAVKNERRMPRMSVWIDEEGLCKNHPRLNIRASIMAGRTLYGNALLCGDSGTDIVPLNIPNMENFCGLLTMEAMIIENQLVAGTIREEQL